MNEAMKKSLTALIDETLLELEELKKSSRFSASEIKLEGPGETLNTQNAGEGNSVNGTLGKEEACMKEEDCDHEDKKEEEKEELEKEEKEEDEEEKKKKEAKEGSEEKKDEPKKEEPKEDKEYFQLFKKSEAEIETLKKSFDERFNPLQDRLDKLCALVETMANEPVAPKAVSARNIVPLKKSEDAIEPLNKTDISNKLFELKKSGKVVDSADFAKIDLGYNLDLIAKKYNLI